jgi:hypothetical protein
VTKTNNERDGESAALMAVAEKLEGAPEPRPAESPRHRFNRNLPRSVLREHLTLTLQLSLPRTQTSAASRARRRN